jgi:hypothetical protein
MAGSPTPSLPGCDNDGAARGRPSRHIQQKRGLIGGAQTEVDHRSALVGCIDDGFGQAENIGARLGIQHTGQSASKASANPSCASVTARLCAPCCSSNAACSKRTLTTSGRLSTLANRAFELQPKLPKVCARLPHQIKSQGQLTVDRMALGAHIE